MKKALKIYLTLWGANFALFIMACVISGCIDAWGNEAPKWIVCWLIGSLIMLTPLIPLSIIAHWNDIIEWIFED